MQTKPKRPRPDYQVTLKIRAVELYDKASEMSDRDQSVDLVYQVLKQTALDSWKNGIEAVRRKASAPAKTA